MSNNIKTTTHIEVQCFLTDLENKYAVLSKDCYSKYSYNKNFVYGVEEAKEHIQESIENYKKHCEKYDIKNPHNHVYKIVRVTRNEEIIEVF